MEITLADDNEWVLTWAFILYMIYQTDIICLVKIDEMFEKGSKNKIRFSAFLKLKATLKWSGNILNNELGGGHYFPKGGMKLGLVIHQKVSNPIPTATTFLTPPHQTSTIVLAVQKISKISKNCTVLNWTRLIDFSIKSGICKKLDLLVYLSMTFFNTHFR